MTLNGSFQKQKRRNSTPLFVLLILSPYIVGFTSDSTSSYTELMAGLGAGQYVQHDCSGAHRRPFADAGITMTRKFESPVRVGITVGGTAVEKRDGFGMLFPDLALDWRYFSFGTTGVRIGSMQELYVETKWLDQPPFASGKGMFRAGIGGYLHEWDSRVWLGMNVLPYTSGGVAAQVQIPYARHKYIFINGRYGNDRASGIEEFGISAGIRIVQF